MSVSWRGAKYGNSARLRRCGWGRDPAVDLTVVDDLHSSPDVVRSSTVVDDDVVVGSGARPDEIPLKRSSAEQKLQIFGDENQ
jgi:hypothetical protein